MWRTEGHVPINRAANVQKQRGGIQTERNLIDEQRTRKDLFSSIRIPLFGSDKQLIIAPMYLISIGHGEDQFTLKAEIREISER